jgi:hypothetical protein
MRLNFAPSGAFSLHARRDEPAPPPKDLHDREENAPPLSRDQDSAAATTAKAAKADDTSKKAAKPAAKAAQGAEAAAKGKPAASPRSTRRRRSAKTATSTCPTSNPIWKASPSRGGRR